jgi:UDPglucose--hexose-1-phosphate uridylyltransferase
MSQLRLDPLTGRWIVISLDRAGRPNDFAHRQLAVEADPERPCPFCPGHEESTPPALETYGPRGDWLVRVVPNRFPAFSGNEPMVVDHLGPVFTQAPASGIHEVLVLTPEHGASFADLSDAHAGLVVAAIRDRLSEHAAVPGLRYSQAIVNAGREAGASLVHPHGQLLAMSFIPREISDEQAGFARFEGSCLLCTTIEAEESIAHRIVLSDEHVLVVCPYWSATAYEMLVIPRAHEAHLHYATPSEAAAVGKAVRTSLQRLRERLGDIAYNVVFHAAPYRSEGVFHWHVHLLPKVTTLAGFELGTGVPINICPPEVAADELRAVGASV